VRNEFCQSRSLVLNVFSVKQENDTLSEYPYIMKQTPFLSFVLPTRDRPQLLQKCLDYLTQQDLLDFEVIVSDNSVNETSQHIVEPYLVDNRFKYYRPKKPLSMSDHWDFAIQYASGEYVTLINEKFLFHPNAASTLKSLSEKFDKPDILSWQFEHFHLSNIDKLVGAYHPLIKPCSPTPYSASCELKRRFDFNEPLFGRHTQEKISYGKIYSGAVKKDIIKQVKSAFGRVFMPTSPDFTSLICFLNFSRRCLDVGRSLMVVVSGENISTGESTRVSLAATKRSLSETYDNPELYLNSLIIPGLGVGHSIFIASDYLALQKQYSVGNLSLHKVNIPAVVGWAKYEMASIQDWGELSSSYYYGLLDDYCKRFNPEELAVFNGIDEALKQSRQPSSREIYHSGLKKVTLHEPDISPERLASYHWEKQMALPRKPVCSREQPIDDAINFFIRYTNCSLELLGL